MKTWNSYLCAQQSCSSRNQLLACLRLHHPEAHQHRGSLWFRTHCGGGWLPPPQIPQHLQVSSCGQTDGPSLLGCHHKGHVPRSSLVLPSRCTAPSRSSRSLRGAAPTGAWCVGPRGHPSDLQGPESQSLGVFQANGSRGDQNRVPLQTEDKRKFWIH